MKTFNFAAVASVAVALALAGPTLASPAAPKPAWAHQAGFVDLKPNGVKLENNSPSDRILIGEAMDRWGIAYDEGRMDVVASLFTDDADLSAVEGSATPVAHVVGRKAIVEMVRSLITQQGDQRRHLMANKVIERLTATEASMISYAAIMVPGEPIIVSATVIYQADLKRGADGVWRFSRMVIGIDNYTGERPKTAVK